MVNDRVIAGMICDLPTADISFSLNLPQHHLELNRLQAQDAGTYVCSATNVHTGRTVADTTTTLVVTGALPHFSQSPRSYLRFPRIDNAYSKFNFEITFRPQQPNGLLLFNGQEGAGSDYIALSLNDGYPEFRFHYGNTPTVIRAEQRVRLNEWHTVHVSRIRKEGYMRVNDQHPIAFPPRVRYGLELTDDLYIGGIDSFDKVPPAAVQARAGFVGCISQLIVQDRRVELNGDRLHEEGTTSCRPCDDSPCHNDGVCLESQTPTGYTCVCQTGFTGRQCAHEGAACTPDVCGAGRCEDAELGIECYCPLNKTGDRCQYIEHLDESTLSFRAGSYAAYRTPKSTKLHVRLMVRPDSVRTDGVLLYVAESETSNGDFAALVVRDGHLEFRYNTGARARPVIVRSAQPLVAGRWTEVLFGRRQGEPFLHVDKVAQPVDAAAKQSHSTMYLKTHLYVGGFDRRMRLNTGVDVASGFDGCITGLEVSNRPVDMIQDILDAANIQNCGESNELSQPNDGDDDEASGQRGCPPGLGGTSCDHVLNACIAHDPCMNDGQCRSIAAGDFRCDCPLGYTGDICQYRTQLDDKAHFKGDGYLELNRSRVVRGPADQRVDNFTIAVMLSTTHPNGLLVWFGQPKGEPFAGQDFEALALVDGYLEYAFRVNSEESVIKNAQTRVDDGERHVAILTRHGNQAQLEIDSFSSYGESRPTARKSSRLNGHVFLGGAPDSTVLTGGRYANGFQGCIHIVEANNGAIHLGTSAVSAVNVDTCPK